MPVFSLFLALLMPNKHNDKYRHKFKKATYKVTNWPEYNDALRKRGDITIWFTEEAIKAWTPEKTGGRGRPKEYSELAIETCLFLRMVYSLPLRQTEGFANSLVRLMALNLDIPDFSTLSKRSINLELSHLAQTLTPGSYVIVDSTGLKVYGKSEWHQEKHDAKAKRTWRKLHIAVDEKHQILAYDITLNSIGDTTGAFDLLAQVEHDFKVVMGDGAYDSFALNEAILTKQPDAKIVIPPPSVAVISQEGNTQRDNHIRLLDELGRMAWQKQNNYGLRSHIELAILRYKKVIGPAMKARELPQQKTEGGIGTRALNRMTSLGMPASVKVK
jgi:hypothetical protein